MYLFDASAILNLVKRGLVRVFADGVTLDLALYEAVNAVWKEHVLLGRVEEDVAYRYIGVLAKVFEAMETLSISGFEEDVFQTACREQLTVYDAAYLYVAMKNGLTLVTDDEKLREKASKSVKTLSSHQLAQRINRAGES